MKMLESVKRFVLSEEGPTAVEYAFLAGFIIVVCATAVGSLGRSTTGRIVGSQLT